MEEKIDRARIGKTFFTIYLGYYNALVLNLAT